MRLYFSPLRARSLFGYWVRVACVTSSFASTTSVPHAVPNFVEDVRGLSGTPLFRARAATFTPQPSHSRRSVSRQLFPESLIAASPTKLPPLAKIKAHTSNPNHLARQLEVTLARALCYFICRQPPPPSRLLTTTCLFCDEANRLPATNLADSLVSPPTTLKAHLPLSRWPPSS